MFESAELGREVDAETYDAEVPKLREGLLHAQAAVLRKKTFPVLVIISGLEAAGKGDTLHMLNEWMDPRHIRARAFDEPDCVEQAHPAMWRYWQALPPSGETAIFLGGWYRPALYGRVYDGEKRAAFEQRLDEITRFEQMLTDEGALVVKYWLHITKHTQKKALKGLASSKLTRWRVKGSDWRNHDRYDAFYAAAEEIVPRTSAHHAPWIVVDAKDARYRRLTVARTLLDAIHARLAEPAPVAPVRAAPLIHSKVTKDRRDKRDERARRTILSALDQTKALAKQEYEERLAKAQGELSTLARTAAKRKRAVIVAFEGPDAAGKGGAIRRMTSALDARHYRVNAVSAPNEEERAHPYLWRFWSALPRAGELGLFDRTWYGRVLVERVEGLCSESAWMRAYGEINDFEAQLAAHGIIIVKFWLAITKAEQLRRFKSREDEAFKRFKITGDDWRNRKKWDVSEEAARDMFDRTSTPVAPWTLVEANDKNYARVKVLDTVVARMRAAL